MKKEIKPGIKQIKVDMQYSVLLYNSLFFSSHFFIDLLLTIVLILFNNFIYVFRIICDLKIFGNLQKKASICFYIVLGINLK